MEAIPQVWMLKDYLLVGAGSHGRVVADLAMQHGFRIDAYSDPRECLWTGVRRVVETDWAASRPGGDFVIGIGGVTPQGLAARLMLFRSIVAAGLVAPALVHRSAIVECTAQLGAGCVVMAGAIIQTGAEIGDAVIVNSGALVEHGTKIGAGTHVAPRAVILGDCMVGESVMVGAAAVILPGSCIATYTGVPSLSRWPGEFHKPESGL